VEKKVGNVTVLVDGGASAAVRGTCGEQELGEGKKE
jgi:hypothetical protein